jgi:hypothetical protein
MTAKRFNRPGDFQKFLGRRKFIYVIALTIAGVLAFSAWRWMSIAPIARALPSNFAAAEIVFKERLRSQFSIGMPESEVVQELQVQGFGLPVSYKDRKYMTFSTSSFPCDLTWSILWHANKEGKITDIDGSYNATCL